MIESSGSMWIDGKLVKAGDSVPSALLNRNVLLGDGIFETLALIDGEVMAVAHHHERLSDAGQKMGISTPSLETFRQALKDTVTANPAFLKARLRVSVYEGHCFIVIQEADSFEEPLKLKTLPFRRNSQGALVGVKSTSYGENMQSLRWAKAQGADEGVFLDTRAYVCECTTSNLFWLKNDVLYTPSLDTGCLPGVGRRVVFSSAYQEGVELKECEKELTDAQLADVVFLSSSLRGMQLVKEWDGEHYQLEDSLFQRLSKRFWTVYRALE